MESAQSLTEQRHAVKEFFPIGWKYGARYYCGYLTSFVLGIVCVIAAIVKWVADMYVLLIILLVALPFGTAIACGALMQWAGNTISGWSSIGGMALGIYFFHKCMEVLAAT